MFGLGTEIYYCPNCDCPDCGTELYNGHCPDCEEYTEAWEHDV